MRWDLPVRTSTGVDALSARPEGGYGATVGTDTITCDNVVVATGTFGRTGFVPDFATELDPSITQLHSSQYRRPSQLQPGRVLVVGASHCGTDIAYELALTHETILCGRDPGQVPFRLKSRKARVGLPMLQFVFHHVLTRRTPIGRKDMPEVRNHGGLMLRVKRNDLVERGVERVLDRVTGVSAGLPVLGDQPVEVRNVVWCTGFRQVFDWIHVILGDDGWPLEYRGVVGAAPGLYFCGLSFQYAFSSMLLRGVGRDAEYVARRIAAGTAASAPAADLSPDVSGV